MPPAQPHDDDRTLPSTGSGASGGHKPKPVPASKPPTESEDATIARPVEPTLIQGAATHAPRAVSQPTSRPPAAAAATAAAHDAEPKLFANRFEVVAMLGEGGMGKVYSARDRQIEGRAVALKVLLPKFSKNEKFRSLFFQEIRAAQNFVSEHVVQVRDCGQVDDGRLFVTMDLVQGEALRDLLKREGVLRPRHALEIARQTLLALQSGHERGFVHRDIKPANIMLAARVPKTDDNPYGVGVRLLDFGIAGLAAELDDAKLAGTPMYMSPEQVQGQRLDARSDLFAVGVVLYEMFAGRRPFSGTTVHEITQSVIETNLSPLIAEMKELSSPIRKILEKALQKDREKRFQSAAEFITAIEKSSAYKLPSSVPGWAWGALAVVGIAAAVEGAMLGSRGTREQALEAARDAAQQQLTKESSEHSRQITQLTGEKDQQIADLRTQLGQANSELGKTREQLAAIDTAKAESKSAAGDDIVKLQGQLNTQSESLARLQDDLKSLKEQRDAEQREKERLQHQLDAQQQEQTRLAKDLTDMRQENTQLKLQSNPAARRSKAFDDLMSLLERGAGAQAAQYYEQAFADRVFDRPAKANQDLLSELVAATADFETFDASRAHGGELQIGTLLDANRHLGTAQNLREGFALAAGDWLGYDATDSSPVERLTRLDAYFTALAAKVQPQMSSIGSYHSKHWEQIQAAGPGQDPARAIAHAATFACTHVTDLAHQAAESLRATCEHEGQLDLRQLSAQSELDAWADYLAKNPELAKDPDGVDLVLFGYARRWYDDDATNDTGFDFSRFQRPTLDGPSPNWRQVLALEYELAQPNQGFPIRAGRTLVYRYQDGATLLWRVVDGAPTTTAGTDGSWDIRRSQYKADAMPLGAPTALKIVRRGSVFSIDGASDAMLDVKASGAQVWAAPYPKLFAELPPPQLRVSQVSMDEYRATLAKPIGPCLVFRRGSATRWYSPQYGLVLEESAGGARLELVFATPLR